jgi:hypothetical protein
MGWYSQKWVAEQVVYLAQRELGRAGGRLCLAVCVCARLGGGGFLLPTRGRQEESKNSCLLYLLDGYLLDGASNYEARESEEFP